MFLRKLYAVLSSCYSSAGMADSWNSAAVLDSLQQYGLAVISSLGEHLVTALQAEAAASLGQAEAQICADGCEVGLEDVASQMGCIFQVLPDLGPNHPARSSAQYWQLRLSWPCQQAVAAFLQSPPLSGLLQAVLGSREVLLYNEQYIIKPPHVNLNSAFGWHYDSQYATSTGRSVVHSPYLSLWVALDDMTAENGCLIVWPGGRGSDCGWLNKGTHAATHLCCSSTQECLEQLASLKQQQRQQQPCHQRCQQQSVHTAQHATSHEGEACSQHLQCQDQEQSTQQQACCRVDDPQQLRPPAGSMIISCSHSGCCSSNSSRSSSHCEQTCGHLPPVGLLMPAGTAVLFWDDVWHCSGPNSSSHTRSAYMAQFSSQPLTWQDSGELVGLAVPL